MRDAGPARARDDDRAVEAWVRQDLARKFGPVLSEPVPVELLALLARI